MIFFEKEPKQRIDIAQIVLFLQMDFFFEK